MNPQDEAVNAAFKRRVATEFAAARNRAVGKGQTVEEFVRNLGITRAALSKYVNGKSIPSLRVLSRARRFYNVNLSYGELGGEYVKRKRKDPSQLEFQFSVGDISKEQIVVKKFSPKPDGSAELWININFSKRA